MLDGNAAVKRIETLIERGIPFGPTRMQGRALTHAEEQAAVAWVESVIGVVRSIDPSLGEHYRSKCGDLSARFDAPYKAGAHPRAIRSECVGELVSVLQDLLAAIQAGRFAGPAREIRRDMEGPSHAFAGSD